MSRFKQFASDDFKDYPLAERPSKVGVAEFARPVAGDSIAEWVESLPDILAARELKELARSLHEARALGKPILWGFGGHVVKVGLAPVLIDLMQRGFVNGLATNGSGLIHDFEVALAGQTSEDVEAQLGSGAFGMARETGAILNRAFSAGAECGQGMGEAAAAALNELDPPHGDCSLLVQSSRLKIPLTVHVAVGTDIIHNHPEADGAAMGQTSLVDFKIFTQLVSELEGGGVYLNVGSAVIMPEIFLKAISRIRNAGLPLQHFTTANLDFIQHYRPRQNVVNRPVADGGQGFALTGHHEIMVPLLAAMLIHCPPSTGTENR